MEKLLNQMHTQNQNFFRIGQKHLEYFRNSLATINKCSDKRRLFELLKWADILMEFSIHGTLDYWKSEGQLDIALTVLLYATSQSLL